MYDVLTIGTATRDVFLQSPLFRVVKDPEHLSKIGFPTGEAQCFALGGKIEVGAPALTAGGGAANAAVTFARQGFKTQTLISLGKDENGTAILSTLRAEGVACVPQYHKTEATAYSTILISSGGERTILTHRGASESLVVPKKKLSACAAYVVPGGIAPAVIKTILSDLKESGVFIAMNPSKKYIELGKEKLKPFFELCDVVNMNREEAAAVTGVNFEDVRGIFKALDELVKGVVVMTDGPRGVWVSDGAHLYRAGIFREKKLVDRTGSGDAFGSGFVAGLLKGKMKNEKLKKNEWSRQVFGEAIRLGSANATAVVETIGAQSGILTKKTFETERRFKHLEISSVSLLTKS